MVTDVLLDHLALDPGDRVLDIGSGGGPLSLAMAARVGPTGSVTGVDFSTALVDLARSRAMQADIHHLRFVVADAQEDRLPGAPFTVAASQFGVMFFDHPRRAFTNIARHVEARGRLCFACWGALEDNPWCVTPTIAAFLPPPPVPPPGAAPTGAFAFGDPHFVEDLLSGAGWVDIEHTAYERRSTVRRAALVDEANALSAVPVHERALAERALAEHLVRFERGGDRFEVPLLFQVFSARRA